jgi:transcriptional regulator with XRE-family HTH domain
MNASNLTEAIRDYGSAKELARIIGCSEATAARYRRGETMPDALGLARLMARSRSIANAMLRLAGLDDLTMDLEEARLVRELHALQARREVPHAATEAASGAVSRPLVGLRDQMVDRAAARMSGALEDARNLRGSHDR